MGTVSAGPKLLREIRERAPMLLSELQASHSVRDIEQLHRAGTIALFDPAPDTWHAGDKLAVLDIAGRPVPVVSCVGPRLDPGWIRARMIVVAGG